MKYKDMPYAAYKIADAMYDRYIETADVDTQTGELSLPDLIVSVPMNEVKKRARGYDQAEVIASALASRLGVKYSEGLLVRNAETSVMSALSRAERGANIACAIELRCELAQDCCKDMQIVLIDDVYTTGSTADACAAVLKQAGAASVKVFTFATGTDMHITSRRNG
jgi:ComF family protein